MHETCLSLEILLDVQNGKVTVLGNPCPAFLFVVRFPSRNLKCHAKKGVLMESIVFCKRFWMAEAFYRWESFSGAPFLFENRQHRKLGDNELDLHDGPEAEALQVFLGGNDRSTLM